MKYEDFLKRFNTFMGEKSIEWAIVGSYAMLAHGLDIRRQPTDLDLMTARLGINLIEEMVEWLPNKYKCSYYENTLVVSMHVPDKLEIACDYDFKGLPRCSKREVLGGIYPVQALEDLYWCKNAWRRENVKHLVDMSLILEKCRRGILLL